MGGFSHKRHDASFQSVFALVLQLINVSWRIIVIVLFQNLYLTVRWYPGISTGGRILFDYCLVCLTSGKICVRPYVCVIKINSTISEVKFLLFVDIKVCGLLRKIFCKIVNPNFILKFYIALCNRCFVKKSFVSFLTSLRKLFSFNLFTFVSLD